MTADAITMIRSGPYTSVQDRGRAGHQAVGVPESGALDRVALRLGNALVGNPADKAGLEICLGGVQIAFQASRRVALTGSVAATMVITDHLGHDITVYANRSIRVHAGQTIHINGLSGTNTVFLAISGGIGTPPLYGSRATSPNAMIGGLKGRLLKDGDVLPLCPDVAFPDTAKGYAAKGYADKMLSDLTVYDASSSIRVVFGPQDDRFTDQAKAVFLSSTYQVSPLLNRMGMRLDGPVLEHCDNADIASDGIVNGSVQVPGDGKPIILLADHQTTGGYTKIATVIQADLPMLARRKPGDSITFTAISVEEAEQAARDHEALLCHAIETMVAPPPMNAIASPCPSDDKSD